MFFQKFREISLYSCPNWQTPHEIALVGNPSRNLTKTVTFRPVQQVLDHYVRLLRGDTRTQPSFVRVLKPLVHLCINSCWFSHFLWRCSHEKLFELLTSVDMIALWYMIWYDPWYDTDMIMIRHHTLGESLHRELGHLLTDFVVCCLMAMF